MGKGRAKQVKMTRKVKDFILEKLSQGLTVAEIKRNYPDQCPAPETVARKALKDPEWAAELDQGYTLWYFNKMDELDRLSNGLACQLYPGADFREAEAALKRRIDALKFALGKMAPVLSKRFDKTQKIEVSGDSLGPQIAVINYHIEEQPKLQNIKDINNLPDTEQ